LARRHGRRMAMAAAGLATAATPFVLGHQSVGAAESTAFDEDSLQFVTFSGATIECTATLGATHDTDDPNQPELRWGMGIVGGDVSLCQEALSTSSTATYKDEGGTTRTARFAASGVGVGAIQGAYDDTSVTTNFIFGNCDPEQSDECILTLTASPK
jgi:hypothetical protein